MTSILSQSTKILKSLTKLKTGGGGGEFYFEYPLMNLATFPNNFNHWQTKSNIQRLKILTAKPKEERQFEDLLSHNEAF